MWYCCFKNYVLLRNKKSRLAHWFRAVYVNISLTSVLGSNPSGAFFFFFFFFGTILFLNIYVDITLCWTIELDCLNLSLLISAICKIFSNLTASILWYTIRGLSQNCVNWGLNLNSVCCDHFMIDQNIQMRAYMYNIRLEK